MHDGKETYRRSPEGYFDLIMVIVVIDQFRYIKIHAWLRGLGEWNKRNELFNPEPRSDFFCFIPPSLGAKHEF